MPDDTPTVTDENPTVENSARAPSAPAEPPEQIARRLHLLALSLLALLVGVITGFGAVGFRDLIGLVHNAVFLRQYSWAYNSSLFTPFNPWGPYVILVPVARRHRRHLAGVDLRPGGEGPRRAGGNGRDLLQAGHHPPRCRSGEIPRLRRRDRHRRRGRARRADHPDRFCVGVDLGAGDPDAGWPAHHAGRGRGRGRDRRHLQHPHRRRAVRHRVDAAGDQRQHLPACGRLDRHGDLHRPFVLRLPAGVHSAGQPGADTERPGCVDHLPALRRPGRADRLSPPRCSSAGCIGWRTGST